MSGGTLISYQGFACSEAVFRRSRGWSADTSTVVLPVDAFGSWRFDRDSSLEEATPRTGEAGDLAGLASGAIRDLAQPRTLGPVGELVLAETVDGAEWVVRVPRLWVARVETRRLSPDGAAAVLVVHLVDERFFFARGLTRRWSFNRRRADGSSAVDSLRDDGKPWTLRQVAAYLASELPLRPSLARAPAEWDALVESIELEPMAAPAGALRRLCLEHGTEELCLRLDGSLAIHESGDGRVGFARGSTGDTPRGENLAEIPETYRLDKGGAGQGRVVQPEYPEPFAVVVGGARVATVALDDWEPVLLVSGRVLPLVESTVRELTGNRFGLEWLARWILAPAAIQNDVDLPLNVTEILRSQAWKLWRLPRVADAEGRPGPNAHLLPLLPRAESQNGRRLPVSVETYRFAQVHVALNTSQEDRDLSAVWRTLAELRDTARRAAGEKGVRDPWGVDADVAGLVSAGDVIAATPQATDVSSTELQEILDQARAIKKTAAIDSALGRAYEDAFRKKLELEDEASGGSRAQLLDVAKDVIDLETAVRSAIVDRTAGRARATYSGESAARVLARAAGRDKGSKPDPQLDAVAAKLKAIGVKLEKADAERRAKKAQGEARARAGASPLLGARPLEVVHYRNLGRTEDTGARVVDEAAGIVRVSALPGWLTAQDVPQAFDGAPFVPGPVRVVFGARTRPRTDRPQGRRPDKPESPGDRRDPALGGLVGGDDRVPEVLTDDESLFVAAFARERRGLAKATDLASVPHGRASRVSRPDLVELIPLEGVGNSSALRATAQGLASALFRRPDVVETTKHVFGRPWPIQCDGVVAEVEIRSRPGGLGFETRVSTGSTAWTISGGTRQRGAASGREVGRDGAEREGLS